MGIEKMIPKLDDLAIFTRMLARSATGQAITTYTSHFKKPSPNKEIHIIIVDNGRSDMLKDENFMQSLKCIRCGACMNSCPIFKKAGGHNYSYTIPGPIGSNLGANKDIKKHGKMVFASTLCGSCSAVCPVEINLHEQLLAYRSEYKKVVFEDKDKIYKAIFYLFKHPKTLRVLTKFASLLPHTFYKNRWGKDRVAPKLAKKSFKDLYEQQR
jgi:L-lactate dehydrogenase complex protein LldF